MKYRAPMTAAMAVAGCDGVFAGTRLRFGSYSQARSTLM
jgi:hypothetical protein